ncbi:hypothetical protein [uncultured Meiothermus sp.]|jgi:cytochrome bd-type quinol oxidase subunit 1|uniref:hypothetical protein n=1 Tax=uncultured Meiothermus sp. TaxID=157471 RepID=UPI002627EF1E|nr:hypothetical protein [uncultured Meiothermus sp.]
MQWKKKSARLSVLGRRRKGIGGLNLWLLGLLVALSTAQAGALFDARAATACNNIVASLVTGRVVVIVGFVLVLLAVWGWYLNRSKGLDAAIQGVVGAVVIGGMVGIGAWFGLGC